MNTNIIKPWEEEVGTNEFFVPEYIEKLASQVLENYHLSVKSMKIVTTKPDKGGAIWKLETSEGPVSLKLLHRRP
ncbi:MAG: CotS family spore coat protein, partial [Heyndrickxia sp.]